MMKISLKSFVLPLIAAMPIFSSCGHDVTSTPVKQSEKKINGVTYTVIDSNLVGVKEAHNRTAAYLYNANPDYGDGDGRRSVYYLKEGAVVTEVHTGQTGEGSMTNIMPRPIRQMLDFEYKEYKIAKDFYDSCMGIKAPPAQSVKSFVADSAKKDSIKGGPQ